MPEKKYRPEGHERPMQFSDEEVASLAAGHLPERITFERSERPKELTQADVDALASGKEVDLEALPPLETGRGVEAHDRPVDLSKNEVENLIAGKDVDLASKSKLSAQRL